MERFSGPSEPPTPRLRASDAERDAALRALATHFADGRLDQAEFDRRSDAALAARLRGDLTALFADLPSLPAPELVARPHGVDPVFEDAGAAPPQRARGRRPQQPGRLPPAPVAALLLAAFVALVVVGAVHGVPPFPLLGVLFILARRRRRWHREARPWM